MTRLSNLPVIRIYANLSATRWLIGIAWTASMLAFGLFVPEITPTPQYTFLLGGVAGSYLMMIGVKFKDRIIATEKQVGDVAGQWLRRRVHRIGTDRHIDRLTDLAVTIPGRCWRRWSRLSVYLMLLCILIWGAIAAALVIRIGTDIVVSLQADPSMAGETPQPGAPSPSGVLAALPAAAVNLARSYVLYCGIMLVLLPGIVFHEFGHFVAAVREGVGVEEYGVLFVGPVPVGAYVEMEEDWQRVTDRAGVQRIAAAGILSNVVWGLLLIGVASTVALASGTAFLDLTDIGISELLADPQRGAVTGLLLVGLIEIGMGFFNAVPIWRVDGGLFRRASVAHAGAFALPDIDNHRLAEGVR